MLIIYGCRYLFTHPYALKDFLGNGQSQGVLSVQPYHETGGALERLASVLILLR